MKKILITGSAGFIGYHLVKSLVCENVILYGVDNLNDYYSTRLKFNRLLECGIQEPNISYNTEIQSKKYNNYFFTMLDIEDSDNLFDFFKNHQLDVVINLAAQAGVRYSITNPGKYINTNIFGFYNILEACRNFNIRRLLFASSSSVYGISNKSVLRENDYTDSPVSLYAATKKSNEVLAYSYSHLYDIEIIGLRFFTVYGPWGRPDMAPFIFADAIINDKPINVFNNGDLSRDFTYIDDIISGIVNILLSKAIIKYKIYNIGNGKPTNLLEFINLFEVYFNKPSIKNMCTMQPGDVLSTFADINNLKLDTAFRPKIDISTGVKLFLNWYVDYTKKYKL